MLASVLAALFLCSCGDSENYVNGSGHSYWETHYTYYYRQDCFYDSFDVYLCEDLASLSSPLRIYISVEVDGYASVRFDGYRYTYYADEYDYGYDEYTRRNYYQFPMDGGYLTIYDDGSEAIYSDPSDDSEAHYLYSY